MLMLIRDGERVSREAPEPIPVARRSQADAAVQDLGQVSQEKGSAYFVQMVTKLKARLTGHRDKSLIKMQMVACNES